MLFLFGGVLSSHPKLHLSLGWDERTPPNKNNNNNNNVYMALISLRIRSHVNVSMVVMRADHLFIHNYIRSLLNNILRRYFIKLSNIQGQGSNPCHIACVSDALATEPHWQYIYIYIYIYI